ncbi:unnamed protein product [Trichogramma brassicae]|uniref:Uncharacterized protein n=1 Tax=Trichogramma brassicae TaxID=86971 RepID=A0A6H5J1H5_9HYME|nr:unnamed protein product [Trichogramma brassicae]
MNWLLAENVKSKHICNMIYNRTKLVKFAIEAGYKDRPELGEDGKPILRRATALHCAARQKFPDTVRDLFKIYTSYDANYTDDRGLTHFHVACEFGHADVVKKFLEHGLNPDCSSQETKAGWVDPPIHLAVAHEHKKIVQLLLKHGAEPFLTDADGWTPVHIICERIRQEKRASKIV